MSAAPPDLDDLLRRLADAQGHWLGTWRRQMEIAAPPIGALMDALTKAFAQDPAKTARLNAQFAQKQYALWRDAAESSPMPTAAPQVEDPRFRAPEWREIAWFDYLRRSYDLSSRWFETLLDGIPRDHPDRRKLAFFGRQLIDAASPSNLPFTNPEVLKRALDTGGRSFAQGLANLNADIDKGRVAMTDESAFLPGRNLALTPGAVVYRNELIELLQYQPATQKVRQRPLLIVPPFINKYYILDLQPRNSFVRYCVERGLTVFMISWRNVDASVAHLTWDHYIVDGVHAAIETIRRIHPRRALNTLGFCVGGTLLATALAVMTAANRRAVASLTLLASMLDFTDTGDIAAYVDRDYVRRIEAQLGAGGIFPGRTLAQAFASLRPNDLVWRYVVGNYLKGETPPAFDLLYWNSDSADLPGPLYAYYLRNMYLDNALRERGRLRMCGVPLDLGRLAMPAYVLAAKEDHIVPWRTAYASARLLSAPTTFVRAASGHIAGVISPPGQKRRSYRTGPIAETPESWDAGSAEHPGSWWEHWSAWIEQYAGPLVQAPKRLGNAKHPPLDAAPGRYVMARDGEHASGVEPAHEPPA